MKFSDPVSPPQAVYLVSACLMGLRTRYDGAVQPSPAGLDEFSGAIWVPVCPEQLGGLPTPRVPADLAGGDGRDVLAGKAKVITAAGEDVTDNFLAGAEQVLAVARGLPVQGVLFKARSPSCGFGATIGVAAALLDSYGYRVLEF